MKKNKGGLSFILSFAKPYKKSLWLALLFAAGYVACSVMIPLFSGQALDSLSLSPSSCLRYIWILLVLALCGPFFYYGLTYLANEVAYKMTCDMRKKAMNTMLNCRIGDLDGKSHGDIISTLIADVDVISQGLILTFLQFFTGIMTIASILILMLCLCYPLALIVILFTPLSMVAAYFIAKGTARSFKAQSDARGRLNAISVENIENQKTVKINSYQKESQEVFDQQARKLRKLDFRTEFFNAFINPTTRMLNSIIYGAVAITGAVFILNGLFGMSEGNLLTFLMYTNNYTDPFNQISEVIAEMQNALASAKRLQELMSLPQTEDRAGAEDIQDPDGTFSLNNVSFAYEKGHPILKDVSFKAESGMKVALVGPTGCGKTTLINLVMRFYDPEAGSICLSNKDVRDIKRSSLRNIFGMVLQDTWVFTGTIKDNIRYGRLDATDQEVEQAAKKANADFFITQMKDGYDTVLSSSCLSEGQKQLICIARLMLKKPKMLILDEATSNIDTRSEALVQKGFDSIMEGRTSLVIAHRLSTIVSSDLIIVMKDGRIVEKGTHESLMREKGFYSELYNSQFAS